MAQNELFPRHFIVSHYIVPTLDYGPHHRTLTSPFGVHTIQCPVAGSKVIVVSTIVGYNGHVGIVQSITPAFRHNGAETSYDCPRLTIVLVNGQTVQVRADQVQPYIEPVKENSHDADPTA